MIELTPRERAVAALVSEGRTNKEIARVLGVSPRTIDNQILSASKKLGVHNRVQLAVHVCRAQYEGELERLRVVCEELERTWRRDAA